MPRPKSNRLSWAQYAFYFHPGQSNDDKYGNATTSAAQYPCAPSELPKDSDVPLIGASGADGVDHFPNHFLDDRNGEIGVQPSDEELIPADSEICDLDSTESAWSVPRKSSGWKRTDVCALLEVWRVENGVSKIAIGKLLQILSLVADHQHDPSEADLLFPDTADKFFRILKPFTSQFNPKSTYICTESTGNEKCWGRLKLSKTASHVKQSMICEKCGITAPAAQLLKSNFYWTGIPLREIIADTVARFRTGFRWKPQEPQSAESPITDILNGKRVLEMDVHPDDVKIMVYADGAQISKSSSVSCYFVYVSIVDFHPAIRETLLYIYAAYVHRGSGTISADREFIMGSLVNELRKLDRSRPNEFEPVAWTDDNGQEKKSGVVLVAVKGDSPELHALAGYGGTSAKSGCILCHQVGVSSSGICYPYNPNALPPLRTHVEVVSVHEKLKACAPDNPFEYIYLETTDQLQGIKRISTFGNAPGFNMVSGFIPDEMHSIFAGVGKRMAKLTLDYKHALWVQESISRRKKRRFESAVSRMEMRRNGMRTSEFYDRLLRETKYYKCYKAHEHEFNVIHAGPFYLHGLIPDKYWLPWKELSRLVDICHKPKIYRQDLEKMDAIIKSFFVVYTEAYGEENIKSVVHTVSHLQYVVSNYGPTHKVSCADGENQNGKLTRRNTVTNETTAKSIVQNYCNGLSCKRVLLEKLCSPNTLLPDRMKSVAMNFVRPPPKIWKSPSGARVATFVTYLTPKLCTTSFEAKRLLLKFFPNENDNSSVWLTDRIFIAGRFHVRSSVWKQCKKNEIWFFTKGNRALVKVWFIATMGSLEADTQWYAITKSWPASSCSGYLEIEHFYKLPDGDGGKTRIIPVTLLSSQAVVLSDCCQKNPDVAPESPVILSRENRQFRAK